MQKLKREYWLKLGSKMLKIPLNQKKQKTAKKSHQGLNRPEFLADGENYPDLAKKCKSRNYHNLEILCYK